MITIVGVLIAGVITFIQANFNRIFKELRNLADDIAKIKENCKFCKE